MKTNLCFLFSVPDKIKTLNQTKHVHEIRGWWAHEQLERHGIDK